MNNVKFGNTGMDVSQICLGCMSFGEPVEGGHSWVLNEEKTNEVMKKALDVGINFFDTANVYSGGTSEEYLGKAIKKYANRDEVVIATKVFFNNLGGIPNTPNSIGLSRKSILSNIDKSLKRLDMDYVDLYIIHRWDHNTPIEETMEALHDVVKSGKARYIGASAMYAWQFQKALHTAEKNNWTKFVSMQNHYNLIYREDEREMMPLCVDQKIASTPYSPLAAGRLSRDFSETTERLRTDKTAVSKYDGNKDIDRSIIERVAEIAKNKNISRTEVALAWLLHKKSVVSPIIGATKPEYIDDAVAATNVKLSSEEMIYLEEPYQPHNIVGAL